MPRMRCLSSFSKPFITDSTVISVVTPSAMPSIELSEIKEMKWLRRFAREHAAITVADGWGD